MMASCTLCVLMCHLKCSPQQEHMMTSKMTTSYTKTIVTWIIFSESTSTTTQNNMQVLTVRPISIHRSCSIIWPQPLEWIIETSSILAVKVLLPCHLKGPISTSFHGIFLHVYTNIAIIIGIGRCFWERRWGHTAGWGAFVSTQKLVGVWGQKMRLQENQLEIECLEIASSLISKIVHV